MEQKTNLRYEIASLAERFRHYVEVLDDMLENFSVVNIHSNGKIPAYPYVGEEHQSPKKSLTNKQKRKITRKIKVLAKGYQGDLVQQNGKRKYVKKHWTQTPAGKKKVMKNLKRAMAAKRRMQKLRTQVAK